MRSYLWQRSFVFLASTKESLDIKRRHAFMLAGTLLNEYSDLAAAALEFNFHRNQPQNEVLWTSFTCFNSIRVYPKYFSTYCILKYHPWGKYHEENEDDFFIQIVFMCLFSSVYWVYAPTSPHLQVKMLSFNDASGRNLLRSSRTGWMWLPRWSIFKIRVQKLPDLCFFCWKT